MGIFCFLEIFNLVIFWNKVVFVVVAMELRRGKLNRKKTVSFIDRMWGDHGLGSLEYNLKNTNDMRTHSVKIIKIHNDTRDLQRNINNLKFKKLNLNCLKF